MNLLHWLNVLKGSAMQTVSKKLSMFPTWKKNVPLLFGEIYAWHAPVFVDFAGKKFAVLESWGFLCMCDLTQAEEWVWDITQ